MQVKLAISERVDQLEAQNRLLSARDRIREATAAAITLLTLEKFDEAVNTALQIIGESLDTDRVCVLEHCDDALGQSLGHLKVLYEWDSAYAGAQISHPELTQVSYEGIEE